MTSAVFHSPSSGLLQARRANIGGTSDERMHEGRPVLTRPYRGDGRFDSFVNFLHKYSGWPPRLCSNYGHLRSHFAETEAGVRYFVETLARACYTTEPVPFQHNTGEERTDLLGTPISWVPVVNTDPPPYLRQWGEHRALPRLRPPGSPQSDVAGFGTRCWHRDGTRLVRLARATPGPGGRRSRRPFPDPFGPGWGADSPYTRLNLDTCGGATFHHEPRPRYTGHGNTIHCNSIVSTVLDGFVSADDNSTVPADLPQLGPDNSSFDGSFDDSSTTSTAPPTPGPGPVLALILIRRYDRSVVVQQPRRSGTRRGPVWSTPAPGPDIRPHTAHARLPRLGHPRPRVFCGRRSPHFRPRPCPHGPPHRGCRDY